jgi:CRISPR-associated endonuclease/helicase Cas3
MVYSEYVLLRTLEIWDQTTAVSLPEDIRSLIERTYQDRHEEGLAAHYKHLLVDKKDSLQRLARLGLSKGIQTLPETKASTRYSEQENVEVLLLSKKVPTDHGMLLVFLDGSSIDVSVPTTDRAFKREVAIAIKQNSIKVADYLAPDVSTGISMFKDFVYTGSRDDGEEPFRVALVSRDTEITGLDTSRANKTYLLHYDSISGYQCEKYQEIQ